MDGGAVDVVCRMMGYDHGTMGSSPCVSYGGVHLCAASGSPVAMKSLRCGGGSMDLNGLR